MEANIHTSRSPKTPNPGTKSWKHRLGSPVLAGIERVLLAGIDGDLRGPVFIVGPPRSGTTLFYQLIVECFEVAYISNVGYRFPEHVVAASWVWQRVIRRRRSTFRSNYGKGEGLTEPIEADRFWKQWFPRQGRPADSEWLSEESAASLRRVIGGLEQVLDGPFVNKHVEHSIRMLTLSRAFPNACYLHIRRDPIMSARSIMSFREDRVASGSIRDLSEWVSVQPREIQQLRSLSPVEQVCGQVYFVNKNIEEDAAALNNGRCLSVNYEKVCADPKGELQKIQDWLSQRGIIMRWRSSPPPKFEASGSKYEGDDLVPRLRKAFSALEESASGCSPAVDRNS